MFWESQMHLIKSLNPPSHQAQYAMFACNCLSTSLLFFLISSVSSFLVWWTPLRVFGWATGCRRVMFTPRSSRSWQAGSEPDTQTARAGIKEEVDSLPPSWPMLDNDVKHCCCYRQADQIWGKTGQEMGGRWCWGKSEQATETSVDSCASERLKLPLTLPSCF